MEIMISIRKSTIEDSEQIFKFINELAIYEDAENEVTATIDTVKDSIFGSKSNVNSIMCFYDGNPIGFAIYFFNYSTWHSKKGLYLEDIYVKKESRRVGAGKKMMQYLSGVALDNDCSRFEWSVLDWNKSAINFYETLGAKPQNEWIRYRIDEVNLKMVVKK
tara:strand:- start:429 stop:914 length:486 start_codon:yes stop_codon:yes gene_type:complete